MDLHSRTPRRLPQPRGIRRQPSQSPLGRPAKRRLAPAQWRRDSPRMLARGWRGAGAMLESMLARWWRPFAGRVPESVWHGSGYGPGAQLAYAGGFPVRFSRGWRRAGGDPVRSPATCRRMPDSSRMARISLLAFAGACLARCWRMLAGFPACWRQAGAAPAAGA